jgi:uncharacterized protein (DUF362 family)
MSSSRLHKGISRRNFLRMALAAAGAALAAPVLSACERLGLAPPPPASPTPQILILDNPTVPAGSPPAGPVAVSPTASPTTLPSATATQEAGVARLAFVKTRDRAQGVRQALALLGISPVQGKQILLKPNFNSADPAPASTHPDTLRALVQALYEMGARQITVADRSGMGHSRDVMQVHGIFDMASELGFDTLSFEDLADVNEWAVLQPPGSHWQKGFPFARRALDAEAIVQTCCLKPHRFGGHFTMSLKNTVGMVAKYGGRGTYNYMTELHNSPNQRLMIAEANTAYSPVLILMDGVEAFIDRGPEVGTKVWGEAIIAGTDRVAVDAAGLALLRLLGYKGIAAQGSIFGQDQIRRAVELGLGVASPDKIRLLTPDGESQAYAAQVGDLLLGG